MRPGPALIVRAGFVSLMRMFFKSPDSIRRRHVAFFAVFYALALGPDGGPLDASGFARLLNAAHADIRDVEFVCEGEVRFVDKDDPDATKPLRIDKIFQSLYAYRASDGASYFDFFAKARSPEATLEHRKFAFIGENTNVVMETPETKRSRPRVAVERGGPGSVSYDGTPTRFNLFWYWREFCRAPGASRFLHLGWETVDGHTCDVVETEGAGPEKGNKRTYKKFWIDMKRNGHVLKYEHYGDGDLWLRVHSVQLAEVALPGGKSVWFPARGVFNSFLNGSKFKSTPVIEETYRVVAGSLVLNQSLRDDRFRVDWTDGSRQPGFAAMKKSFDSTAAQAKPAPPPLRTDPESVAKQQREKLDEADSQARELEASAPSREWFGGFLSQLGLGCAGAAVLAAAFYLRRRSA
ncbi:MAG: hypothetical protein U0835_12825 [Isosphaeraceae bacterium]